MKNTAGCRRAAGYRPENAKGSRPVKRFAALLFALAVLAACTAGEKKNPETGKAEAAEPAAESGTPAGTGMPAESALPARVFEAPASIPAEIIAGINRSKPDFLAEKGESLAAKAEIACRKAIRRRAEEGEKRGTGPPFPSRWELFADKVRLTFCTQFRRSG